MYFFMHFGHENNLFRITIIYSMCDAKKVLLFRGIFLFCNSFSLIISIIHIKKVAILKIQLCDKKLVTENIKRKQKKPESFKFRALNVLMFYTRPDYDYNRARFAYHMYSQHIIFFCA